MSNFEGYKDRLTSNATGTYPTPDMRNGDFSKLVDSKGALIPIYDPLTTCGTGTNPDCPVAPNGKTYITRQQFAGNKIPTSRFDPISMKMLEFWALPNIAKDSWGGGQINYQIPLKRTIDKNQFTQRIDFNESTNSQWAGRFSWTDEYTVNPGVKQAGTTLYSLARQYMVTNTRVLSNSKVSEFRFGLNQFKNVVGQELSGVRNVVEEVGIPGVKYPDPDTWGIPTMRDMVGVNNFGNDTNGPFRIDDKILQFVENFSWIRGKHSIRLGGEYRYDIYNQIGNEFGRPVFGWSGQYTNTYVLNSSGTAVTQGGFSAADVLIGTPSRFDVSVALAETAFRNSNFSAYIDDVWRVTPKLTLNLGLRYEFIQPFRDALNNLPNLYVPYIPNPITGPVADMNLHPTFVRTGKGDFYEGKDFRYVGVKVARDGRLGDRMIYNDWNNFAPRIGIAYSPSSKWSFRTGFGIFYSAESGNSRFDLARGIAGKTAVQPGPEKVSLTYQTALGGFAKPVQLSTPSLWGVVPDVGTSYSYMYLMNVQRSIGKSMALEVGYSGAIHKRLQTLQNMNPAVPGTSAAATRRAWPEFSWLQVVQAGGFGNYNGLGAKFTQRFTAGFNTMISYTWSKALDTGSAIRGNSGDIYPQNSLCLRCDYGYSAYNTPHRLVTSIIYELPVGKGKRFAGSLSGPGGAVVNQIIGGWQLGSIVTIQSGRPINLTTWDSPGQGLFGETRLVQIAPDPYMPDGDRNSDHWLNKSAFRNTNAGEFGNLMRNALIGPSQFYWDFSAIKNFPIWEEHRLQFRFEAFNVANHPVLGNPSGWGSSTQIPNANFGRILGTSGSMRQLQFALKYTF